MTTITPKSLTNEGLKTAFLFNEFIENSEYEYKSADDDNIFDNETTSYVSRSFDRNSNHDSDNIDTFTLNKVSFENVRIFAENNEIPYDTFWKDDDGLENNFIFSTELESTSTITHDESIILEDSHFVISRNTVQSLSSCVILDIINSQFQQCCAVTLNQQPLTQLIGTWEIDKKTFENAKSNNQLYNLGVCSLHFSYDAAKLHLSQAKKEYRGKTTGSKKNRSFSCEEKHINNNTEALKIFGNWILQIATTDNEETKRELLAYSDNDDVIKPLFNEFQFTNNLLNIYENIFVKLLENKLSNWDVEDVLKEIKKNISSGCKVTPPNVVILKSRDNPNCDANVHQACAMYFDDVRLENTNHIDHTSKDMCSALITIFSGYGIFSLAARLGVLYLNKLEKVVNYSATCKGAYWLGYKVGIRKGNFDMQFRNLAAFSSLFLVTRKSNYARSVTYFLSYVEQVFEFQRLLRQVCLVNIICEDHFIEFDEALERKRKIELLISEYISNKLYIKKKRTIKSRKDSLWKLISDLVDAFSQPDLSSHELFLHIKEINEAGF
ncbi:17714_t:CDS:2 [Cetraspora pellucida]|uniref:17714_t:CDS:1 n=1 Tax=Cetraspora pellucida TaxID=1433469 RepID=A0A9N9AQU2_9GLOM|nr:17714_t:CDS:2 [Cetraspora pellucida]